MVFSLTILYSKSALGRQRDVQYDSFLDSTEGIRRAGFLAFSLSLGLFAALVVLVLAEDLPLVLNLPLGGVFLAALLVGFRDWSILVEEASAIFIDEDDY